MNTLQQAPPREFEHMLQLLSGRWLSQAIGAAARLDVATHLAKAPKTAAELAAEMQVHEPYLYRILRALAGFGIFSEDGQGRFSNTPNGEMLRSDVPGSLHAMAVFMSEEFSLRAWGKLDETVRKGGSGFEHVYGEPAFQWMGKHPEEMQVFQNAMTGLSTGIAQTVVGVYDFSRFKLLTDVGGGHGIVVRTVLERTPGLRGRLFDLPEVVAGAGTHERLEIVGGSFFESVPAGGDAYIMKHILHDWSDADCKRILDNIHRHSADGATLVLVEGVVQGGNTPQFLKLLDLEMMAVATGGKERTETEWRELLRSAGWELSKILETPGPVCVLESGKV